MVTAATLMKEIETLPEESVAEVLHFAMFLRTQKPIAELVKPKVKSLYGTLPDLASGIEREEEDRV